MTLAKKTVGASTTTHLATTVTVACAVAFLLGSLLPSDTKNFDWAMLILVGGLVPSILIWKTMNAWGNRFSPIIYYMIIPFILFTSVYVIPQAEGRIYQIIPFIVGLIHYVVNILIFRKDTKIKTYLKNYANWVELFLILFFWLIAFKMIFSETLPEFFNRLSTGVLVFSFPFTLWAVSSAEKNLAPSTRPIRAYSRYFSILFDGIAVGILFEFAFRRVWHIHHWTYFYAPIEAVRQGGWLLREVPSQYGFLNVLVAAVLPCKSAWNAIYILSCSCVWITSLLYYRTCRQIFQTSAGRLFSLIITVSSICLLPGMLFSEYRLMGPTTFPSTGPLRFIWVYVLGAYVTRHKVSARITSGLAMSNHLSGHFLWILGSLWSFESWVYSSAIWVPYFSLSRAALSGSMRSWAVSVVRQGLRLLGIAFLVALSICLIYWVRINAPPDPQGIIEYLNLYSVGKFSMRFNQSGLVWALVCLGSLIITLWGTGWQSTSFKNAIRNNSFIQGLALFSGFIASLTYFFGRSADNSVLNLIPLGVFLTLRLIIATEQKKVFLPFLTPFLVMILLVTWGQGNRLGNSFIYQPVLQSEFPDQIFESGCSPQLVALMNLVNLDKLDSVYYSSDVPLNFHGCNRYGRRFTYLAIPASGPTALLDSQRMLTYTLRLLTRVPLHGYFLKKISSGIDPNFLTEQIKKTVFDVTLNASKVGETQEWQLWKFDSNI